jgi:hypothetical protein
MFRGLLPGTLGPKHDDLRGRRKRGLADGQRVTGEMPSGEPSSEGFDKDEVIPVVHRNSDLGLELLQDLTGDVRTHGIGAANRNQCYIYALDLVQLLGGERMAQVPQMHDAQWAEVEDEGSSLEGARHSVLVYRHVEDQHLSHVGADPIPFGPVVCQAAQDERMALSQLHVVMIGVFPADRDHMGGKIRCRVPAWRQRVGDDRGALARRDLEKVVAEILNDGFGRVRDGGEASGHMQVSTSGFSTSRPKGNQEEGQNTQRKMDMSQHPTPPQHPSLPKSKPLGLEP